MKWQKVALVCNTARPRAVQTARALVAFLQNRGYSCDLIEDYKDLPRLNEADLCVSLGGDGTTLRCARQTAQRQIPLLSVNCGSLGFLAACEAQDAQSQLERVLNGDYQVSPRTLLVADIERKGEPALHDLLAFNDCVLKATRARAFTLRAYQNGEEIKNFYGDGVIVATPSGSTAYSLAAGGPIVEPGLDVVVVTPICPHSLSQRPLLLRADTQLSFTPVFKNKQDRALVSLDGQIHYHLQDGDRVTLRRAPYQVQLICAGKFNFFSLLKRKLERGER